MPVASFSAVDLELWQYGLALVAASCIGLSKTGFSGVSLVAVFILEGLFGAKASVGIALPLLILADLCVYPAFRKHGSWKPVWTLLLPTLVGIGIGLFLLDRVSDEVAGKGIGLAIGVMALLQIIKMGKPELMQKMADSKGFGIFAGGLGGIATMMANAAGPLIQIFLISRNFSKLDLLGIGARFFLLINLIKLPLSGGIGIVTWESLWLDLSLAPGILAGVLVGRKAIQYVPQRVFAWMILSFALLASCRLLF